MNWGKSKVVAITLGLATVIASLSMAAPAAAQDSVTVPGQVTIDQCPAGYQYQTGIEMRIGTGIFTVCYSPLNAQDILKQQQDNDFNARIQSAQAAALSESQAWNAANPGMQKCIQWGPVVHADGVGTSSGGVCANPVERTTPVQTEASTSVHSDSQLPPLSVLPPATSPFTVIVPGQVAAIDCPAGYQAANGLQVNATTHEVTTECWSAAAWKAWQLGGNVWQQFQSSGGTFDVQAELDRRSAVDRVKAQALANAQAAAQEKPGIRHCSAWSGFGESGVECAYVFLVPGATANLGSAETPQRSGSDAAIDSTMQILAAVSKVATAVSSKTVVLPKSTTATISYKSKTTKVCTVSKNLVSRKANGTCLISVTITSADKTTTTSTRKIVFKK